MPLQRDRGLRAVALAGLVAAAIALDLAVLTTPADAGGLTLQQGTITYSGDAGEANDLKISRDDAELVFREASSQGIDPPALPCTGGGAEARCPGGSVSDVAIGLSVEEDRLEIVGSLAGGSTLHIVARGGDEDDTLIGGPDAEQLIGDAGDDALLGNGGDDLLDTGSAEQSAGTDMLDGGPGDDLLGGGPVRVGGETLTGGAGDDTADYSQRRETLSIQLDDAPNDGELGEADNVRADVERVIGGSDGDSLTGNDGPNGLEGRDGDDRLAGREGGDALDGGDGEDTMTAAGGRDGLTGGRGEDVLEGGDDDDALLGGGGSDTLQGDAGSDMLAGGAGSDVLTGGDGDDRLNGAVPGLVGADGDDRLTGGAGGDLLLGAGGDDRLDGGAGPDVMHGEDGRDTVTYEDRTDPILVTLDERANDGERDEGDNVGSDVEVVLGGTLFNTLTGDRGGNTLTGGPEEDFADGRGGGDHLDGGSATDVLRARDGTKDAVACGDGMDLAIVDRRDSTRDCEWIDRPGARRLGFGRLVLVRPQKAFGLRLPNAFREVALEDDVGIPLGSRINPQAGEVRLLAATRGAGPRQRILVEGSPFTVRQGGRRTPSTVLGLAGGTACPGSSVARTGRTLRVRVTAGPRARASGANESRRPDKPRTKVRAKGKYAIAAARGTEWEISDRCDGTFTRALSGTVSVTDLTLDKTVTLKAGKTYLAERP